jgi:hypothetical protein
LQWPVKISYWWPRPWWGNRRKYLPFFGAIMIGAGIYLLVMGNHS